MCRIISKQPGALEGYHVLLEDRLGFDFNEHFGRDKPLHFHHDCGGPHFSENFSVSAPDLLPLVIDRIG